MIPRLTFLCPHNNISRKLENKNLKSGLWEYSMGTSHCFPFVQFTKQVAVVVLYISARLKTAYIQLQ
ncbi:CLUMA_CG002983, isoform A [Clunio marinus]|uniref:CLUMA_CG002983, isoform A n=1 Tax=Clunio marinus TaxID=568069 RepID=A0A1J1HMD0_9DIPT|nr:CLUMA_CG002983, isoform A [Clunio marinus]